MRFFGPLAFSVVVLVAVACAVGAFARGSTPASVPASRAVPVDDPVQEQSLLKVAGDGFRIYKTPHFLVAYNVDRDLVKALSSRLEQTHDSVLRFCQRSGFDVKPLTRRLEVVFLDTWPDYERYGRRYRFNSMGTFGFYLDRTNRSAFFNVENDPTILKLRAAVASGRENTSRLEKELKTFNGNELLEVVSPDGRRARLTRDQAEAKLASQRRELKLLDTQRQHYCDRINRTVVQHETAHQLLYNAGVHVRNAYNPRWLAEGLACMFETPPGVDGSGLGAINQSRLKDFREVVAGNSKQMPTTALYTEAVAKHRMASLRELIGNPDLFDERGDRATAHYAAAWALVHYLHRVHSQALPAYLREVASRASDVQLSAEQELALFEKHFGPVNDAFAMRFCQYILKLPVRAAPGE